MSVFVKMSLEKVGWKKRGPGEVEPGTACPRLFSCTGLDGHAMRRCAGDRGSSLNRYSDDAHKGCL